jgi:hypothetical protein
VPNAVNADEAVSKGQLDLKANAADLKEIGVGQTWVDETANRVAGTTYTNTSGKPILISVMMGTTGDTGTMRMELLVDGNIVAASSDSATSYSPKAFVCSIVPNGSTYKIDNGSKSGNISLWLELK